MQNEKRDRRQFLRLAAASLGLAAVSRAAEAPVTIDNQKGNFRFLRGIAPYSSGATAMNGYEVVHATLIRPTPYRRGLEIIDRHLSQQGRPPQALCGIELRSPRPFTFQGFGEFNQGYVKLLEQRGILTEGLNPVARTNVAPEVDPPSEVLLYGFSYTAPASASGATFVIAGAGELQGERLDARDIIRRGDLSDAGLRAKTTHVLGLMDARLQGLGVSWNDATVVEVYTVHNIQPLLRDLLLPRLGAARIHGFAWHFARPPIQEIEFEMDVRGCRRSLTLQA